ncbi:flagellar biosynthetic protein FliR [Aurantiacibacter odishensis]|uniref:flagellar biosynthetic protein FliR n=1 Tax=Aurantiacibacter odishensis TaxID=1155476 RepID=UPI000E70A6AD|nr:flagellar biosynthetic protein FliR [Aurantiacibacter odishensis]
MSLPDFGLGAIEADLWALIFVMVRVGAAVLAAPIFGARMVPPQVRTVLAGAMGVFILNWVPVSVPDDMLALPTLVSLATEAVIGFSLGMVLQIAFAAPMIAGEQIAGGMGMAMATAVDPSSGAQSGVVGQMFTVMLTLLFLAIGGHLLWLRLVVESYVLFPPGADWDFAERGWLVASFFTQALATAVAIALPVTLVLLLVQLVTGVIGRSAPSLNLFALGLPASVLAGLAALIASTALLGEQFVMLAEMAIEQAGMVVQP